MSRSLRQPCQSQRITGLDSDRVVDVVVVVVAAAIAAADDESMDFAKPELWFGRQSGPGEGGMARCRTERASPAHMAIRLSTHVRNLGAASSEHQTALQAGTTSHKKNTERARELSNKTTLS